MAATAARPSFAARAPSPVVAAATTSAGREQPGRVGDRLQRRVGSEERDAPALPAQREPERDQREIVLLAGNAREQRARARAVAPAAREAEQSPAQQRTGEVLLSDRGVSTLPALAQLVQVGQHGIAQHGVERERGEQAVERGMGRGLVELVERVAQRRGECSRLRRGGIVERCVAGLEQGQAGALRRGDARIEMPDHPAHAALVLVAVEAEAALGPRWRQQPVATLPGPQQLGAHAHAAAELPDAEVAGGVGLSFHDHHITDFGQTFDIHRAKSLTAGRAAPRFSRLTTHGARPAGRGGALPESPQVPREVVFSGRDGADIRRHATAWTARPTLPLRFERAGRASTGRTR